MSETPSDRHNRLAREFVMTVGREASDHAEFMVVIESVLLAAMLVQVRLHQMKPAHAVAMVEEALQVAMERFIASGAREPS